jgi:hypothetical protein
VRRLLNTSRFAKTKAKEEQERQSKGTEEETEWETECALDFELAVQRWQPCNSGRFSAWECQRDQASGLIEAGVVALRTAVQQRLAPPQQASRELYGEVHVM